MASTSANGSSEQTLPIVLSSTKPLRYYIGYNPAIGDASNVTRP
ncbi:unnamed protein product, partial [Rotaria sp. Silwood1]